MTTSRERTRLCLMRLLPTNPVPVRYMQVALRCPREVAEHTLHRMEALGLACRVPSRWVSQEIHYTLTPAGREHYERLRADHNRDLRARRRRQDFVMDQGAGCQVAAR